MEEDDIYKGLNFTMVRSEEDTEAAGWRKSEHFQTRTVSPHSSWFNADSAGTVIEEPEFGQY